MRPGRADWVNMVADLSIASAGLCRSLFEIYLGSSSGGQGQGLCVCVCVCAGGGWGGWRMEAARGGRQAHGACTPSRQSSRRSPAPAAVLPDARKDWAAGARKLLESDDIRRQTRKGGSG